MERDNEINIVFIPANRTSNLQSTDQGAISIFKSYCIRHISQKVIPALDSDFPGEFGQSKLKIFWKGFTILGSIKNISDGRREGSQGMDILSFFPP
jgi:N12 class adenine-specific DNA methylase